MSTLTPHCMTKQVRGLQPGAWRYSAQVGAQQLIPPPMDSSPPPALANAGNGWCYRLKQGFLFKYDALEDEVPVMAAAPQATAAPFPAAG